MHTLYTEIGGLGLVYFVYLDIGNANVFIFFLMTGKSHLVTSLKVFWCNGLSPMHRHATVIQSAGQLLPHLCCRLSFRSRSAARFGPAAEVMTKLTVTAAYIDRLGSFYLRDTRQKMTWYIIIKYHDGGHHLLCTGNHDNISASACTKDIVRKVTRPHKPNGTSISLQE